MTSLLSTLQKLNFSNIKESSNGWVMFSCPIAPWKAEHGYGEDHNPSAGAKIGEDGTIHWNCFCCKAKGKLTTLIGFLGKKREKDYSLIISQLEEGVTFKSFEEACLPPTRKKLEIKEIDKTVWLKLFSSLGNVEAARYLHSRGISAATAKKLGLRYDDQDKRIIFPFIREGKIYGYSGRAIYEDNVPKIKNLKEFYKDAFLLGEHLWQDKPTILVEGLFAFAKLHELGFSEKYDIAALGGSRISREQAEIFWAKQRPVILFLDGDAAGMTGMKQCEEMLSSEVTTYKIKYGETEDIDLLTKEEIEDMLQKATQIA